jgi:hypothetical protein
MPDRPPKTYIRDRPQNRRSEPVALPPPLAPTLGRPIEGVPQRTPRAVKMGGVHPIWPDPEAEDTPGLPIGTVLAPDPGGIAMTIILDGRDYYAVAAPHAEGLRIKVYDLPKLTPVLGHTRNRGRERDRVVFAAEALLVDLAERVTARAAERKVS